MILVHFQGNPFNITVIKISAPATNAKEAEGEWFDENLQDLLELTPKKEVFYIIGDWNVKVGSQQIAEIRCKSLALENKMKQGKG